MTSFKVAWVCALALIVGASAACASVDTTSSLTVYEDAPTLNPVDVGEHGNSPGDAHYFFADLRGRPDGDVTGKVYGTKTVVKPPDTSNPDTEQRATLMFFVFGNAADQIVVAGVPDYPSNDPVFAADHPVVRAVIGGTGKYNGAGGQLTSTRNADGTYSRSSR
ncbi:MAG: hypothetical protein QOJ20_2311 [Mycobacterium sp.]|nr:hypothetical protein [Mycobacterium sp.]